jgi:hypothetical protein
LGPVRSPARLARIEKVSRMSVGSPRSMATSGGAPAPAGPCAASVRERAQRRAAGHVRGRLQA